MYNFFSLKKVVVITGCDSTDGSVPIVEMELLYSILVLMFAMKMKIVIAQIGEQDVCLERRDVL